MRKTPPPDLHKPAPQPVLTSNPIPSEYQGRIRASLQQFRRQYGKQLASLGWNRGNLFLGTFPDAVQSYDHLHGMAALLADGAILVHADNNRLVFSAKGQEWSWYRAGYWLVEAK